MIRFFDIRVMIKFFGENIKDKAAVIKREVFYFFTTLFLIVIVLESVSPKIVLAYFNVNYLIFFWLLSAFINLRKK